MNSNTAFAPLIIIRHDILLKADGVYKPPCPHTSSVYAKTYPISCPHRKLSKTKAETDGVRRFGSGYPYP